MYEIAIGAVEPWRDPSAPGNRWLMTLMTIPLGSTKKLETTPSVEAPAPDDEPPRRAPRWVLVLGAALAGVLAGRFSKRDRE